MFCSFCCFGAHPQEHNSLFLLQHLNEQSVSLFQEGRCGLAIQNWNWALQQLRNITARHHQHRPGATAAAISPCSLHGSTFSFDLISLPEDNIYNILCRSCPEVSVPLFTRVFQITTTMVVSIPPTRTTAMSFSAATTSRYSSVFLFNLALAHHLVALAGDARKRNALLLDQVLKFYAACETTLARQFHNNTSSPQDQSENEANKEFISSRCYHYLTIMALGCAINKRHIQAVITSHGGYTAAASLKQVQYLLDQDGGGEKGRIQAIYNILQRQITSLAARGDSSSTCCPSVLRYLKRLHFESVLVCGIVDQIPQAAATA